MDKEKKENNDYSAKDIQVLTGLEPVRKRPGMYIGSTGVEGLHHLIWEIFDNSIDEAMAGYAKNIEVSLLTENWVTISDDGRGIPTDIHPKTKKSALETAATTLHAGGKFGGGTYKVSGGLHGVGLSVVNALSGWMKAEIKRKPDIFVQEYEKGKPLYPVKKSGKTNETGTKITFRPDPEIFKEIAFNWQQILTHLRQQAYLTKGTKIVVNDERNPIETVRPENGEKSINYPSHTFYFEGGIVSYVNYLNRREEPSHPNIFYVAKDVQGIFVEVALQYTKEIQGHELSFANNVHTTEGGMHLTGFKSAITRTLNDYARKNGFLKEKEENLTGEDAREGLTVIISVKLREPQFEGQTKSKLGTPDARTAVENVVNTELSDWLERNPNDAKDIMAKVILASKARMAAKAARDTVIRKGALEGFTLPGKLADCSSKDASESELFIVEGDSAGGCFAGNTKVALLDGRNVSFDELVKENTEGKKNFCYTIDGDGDVAIAPILNPRVTRKNAEVIKVVLDNGEEIICTPEHRFMLADGTYKEASSLRQQDSLMPLYRKLSELGGRITIAGYEMVFAKKRNYWIFTHLLSDEYNLKHKIYKVLDGPQRHHKDFRKLNNNPNNIVRITREEHFRIHQEIAKTVLRSPEVLEKLRKIRQTPEFRNKIRHSLLKMRLVLSVRAKKQWENQNFKNYMVSKFLDFYRNNREYREKNNQLLNRFQKEYWSSKENRREQAERTRLYFETHPEKKAENSKLSKRQWQDVALRKWRSQKTKEQWTLEFREKRKQTYSKTYLEKALKVFRLIFDKEGRINLEEYNKIRKETGDRSLIRYDSILSRFFNNNKVDFTEAVKRYNHKVKKIIKLDQKTSVYDLEVPETHNFALASGVFVHNSAKQGRNRHFQAILPLKGKILNVERARMDKILGFAEIRALIIALGTAIGDEFDISKLRYHKIVIMTDADTDGAHIRTLLLTLFYRYFPQLIESGHIFIAQPPLFRVQKGGIVKYAYNDEERSKVINELKSAAQEKLTAKNKLKTKEIPKSDWQVTTIDNVRKTEDAQNDGANLEMPGMAGFSISRYKGLGEMDPSQLWKTTMDPENRILLRVGIENAEKANNIFDILMGFEVMPRKKFIQAHAKNVKNLDI